MRICSPTACSAPPSRRTARSSAGRLCARPVGQGGWRGCVMVIIVIVFVAFVALCHCDSTTVSSMFNVHALWLSMASTHHPFLCPSTDTRCRSHAPIAPTSGASSAAPSREPSPAKTPTLRSAGYAVGPERGTGGGTGIGSGSGRMDGAGNAFFDCLVCGRSVSVVV